MARRAIISDIHANLEALLAVKADMESQNVDEVFCLGDVVGYGPDPGPCIDECQQFAMTLLGNHDNGVLFDPDGFNAGAEQAIFWTRQQLEDASQPNQASRWDFLAELPRTWRDGDLLFVHGSPRGPMNEYVFPEEVENTRKMEQLFGFVHQYCFQGHTHVPGVFTENCRFYSPMDLGSKYTLNEQKVMINVGSVGQPRDGDPRSSYVIVEESSVEFRRVEYDPEVTRQKIHAAEGLHNGLGDRLLAGA